MACKPQTSKHTLLSFFTFLCIFAVSCPTLAMNGRTTYQAKIIKPDGSPLEASNVNFKFSVLDTTGSCVLYTETYSAVNMTSTKGLISFALGNGTRGFPAASATTAVFSNVFDNSIISMPCETSGIYNPATNDVRNIIMQFNDGSGWQTLPAMTINAVPYAMYAKKSNDSRTLNGKDDTAFVENSTIAALNCNSSTHAITFNGVSFSCIAVGGGGGLTSAAITTALGYTAANSATVSTINTTLNTVSNVAFSVSSAVNTLTSAVNSLHSTVAASFSAVTSSQWVTSGTTINYMNGSVGIGTISPSARLHLTSGTTTVAPLKIASGALLTSPQSGTIEYDGVNLYFTDGGNARRTIASADSLGNVANISAIINAGNISVTPIGSVIVSSTTNSANSQTGALVVGGGLGIAGSLFSSGTIVTSSNIQGTSITATSGVNTNVIQGNAHLSLNPNGGNVGIGTTGPEQVLHVLSASSTVILAQSSSAAAGVEFRNSLSTGQPESIFSSGDTMYIATAGANRLYINSQFGYGGSPDAPVHFQSNAMILRIETRNSGSASVSRTMNGLDLVTGVMNATNRYGQGLKFMSTDADFTTENPKLLAAIFPRATQTYSSDLTGGMALDFMTTPNNPGANNIPEIRMTIDQSGNVGMGTSNPGYKLDVSGTINIASGSALAFGGTSVCTAAGCTSSSDERLKENIKPFEFDLHKLLSLKGVEYDWKNKLKYGDKHQIGFIAQKLEVVYPEVVYTDKNTGLKSVAYGHLVVPIIEAVKSIYSRLSALEMRLNRQIATIAESKADKSEVEILKQKAAKVDRLESENAQLKNENVAIKAYLCGKDPSALICK